MGEDHKYYEVEDYKRWKRSQGKANKVAPRPNLLAAASWIRNFFDARKTNWAALGSLAMLCLGSRRDIPDIHLVYDDKDFQRIRMKLQTDPRVRLPKDTNPMFPTKLLVSTGLKYKDAGCTENADIEVEMIPPGSLGTPPSDVLRSNQAMLTLNLEGKATNIKGLNMLYLVRTTVHLCNIQDLLWDPKKDLLWLCRKYGEKIGSIRGQLNARQVQENFLGTPFFSKLSVEEQRLCYHILLGKEPPPSMFLTPAPPQGQITSTTARPHIPSHKSAPSLKDSMQQGSAFLRPPPPNKSKTTQSAPSNGVLTQTSPHHTANSPENDGAPEASGDSRSRYRHSSAPTTPSAILDFSPEAATARTTKSNTGSQHPQQHGVIYQAQSVKLQNVAHTSKPQVVQTKKSLPRMNGQTTHAVPVFAHKQSSPHPAAKENVSLGQAVASTQANNSAPLPSASGAQPHMVAHTHPAHRIIAQTNSMMPKDSNKVSAVSSLSTTDVMKTEAPSKGLAIVGPAGLYPTPPRPTTQPAKKQPATMFNQAQVQTIPSSFVFELDATPVQVGSPHQAAPATEFIAELPADNCASLQPSQTVLQRLNTLPETPTSPVQGPTDLASIPVYRDSPVSPPATYRPLGSMILPLNHEPSVRTQKPDPSPTSFDSLPPSLMIGFRPPPQHPPTNIPSHPHASSQSSNRPVALTKYQRYYSPPNSREPSPNNGSTSAPASRQTSPWQGPITTYKAYPPPITPPMQPIVESSKTQHAHPTTKNHALPAPAWAPAPVPVEGAPIPMERVPAPMGRTSPPDILRIRATMPQPLKIKKFHLPNPLAVNPPTPRQMKHDSHQGPQYDTEIHGHGPNVIIPQQYVAHPHLSSETQPQPQQLQYTAFSTQHHRTTSSESNTSTTSHDSEKLAQEYQLGLPSFEDGYGAKKEVRGYGEEQFKLDLGPTR